MDLLLWLLLLARIVATLAPYLVGVAAGLAALQIVPADVPAVGRVVIFAVIAAESAVAIRGQASDK